MTNQPKSFAHVVTLARQNVRLGPIAPPSTPADNTEPSRSPATANPQTAKTRPITFASDTIAFAQTANRADQAFGIPTSATTQNQLTTYQFQTIEKLLAEIEQLRTQLTNNHSKPSNPIPIHAPPVGENFI